MKIWRLPASVLVGFGGGSALVGYVSWLPDVDRLALKFSLCRRRLCAALKFSLAFAADFGGDSATKTEFEPWSLFVTKFG